MVIDFAFARLVEAQQAVHQAEYAQGLFKLGITNGAMMSLGGGMAVRVSPEWPISRAVGMGMQQPWTAADAIALESFYHEASIASTLEICPLADQSLIAYIQQRRYIPTRWMNLYVRGLKTPAVVNPALTVRCLEREEHEQWAAFVGGTDRIGLGFARAAAERSSVSCWVVEDNGQWMAGGALFLRAPVATIFSSWTRPEQRGRGAQMALIAARMNYARESGCEIAIINTVPGSASDRNVRRAEFTLAYTKTFVTLPVDSGSASGV